MQNTFGLKDFVIVVLLIFVLGSIYLVMFQQDRKWAEVRDTNRRIGDVEREVSLLRQAVEEGEIFRAAPRTSAGGDAAAPEEHPAWARPDVPVQWQARPRYVNDPRQNPDYGVGGTFTEIFEGQPPTITPLIYRDVYGYRVIERVVEPLGRYNPATLELEGVLAEAWQYDPEGMWLRIKIWDRARFSDGKPVTAEDVKFSYEMIFNPEIETDRFRASYDGIQSVEVLEPKVLEFQFKEPRFDNLSSGLIFGVLPKHFYEQYNAMPSRFNQSTGLLMGSGPFRLRRLDPDDQWTPPADVVLERNEQYWGPRPALDRLRFKVVPDNVPRLISYNNREGDMMRPTDQQLIRMRGREDWLEENHALEWYPIRGGYNFIVWNCHERDGRPSVFADARVRKAMTHLLDRERMIEEIHEGLGTISTGPFNPDTPAANPSIEPWPYSLDTARELLVEAGWTERDGVLRNARGDALTFEFTYASGSEVAERLANYLRDQGARVGIRVTMRVVDWSVYREILDTRGFDALTMAWSPSVPEADPYGLWHSSQAALGQNYAQWRNAEADRLIEEGRRIIDDAQRMEVWHELHRVIHEDQPYTFLTNRPWLRFISRRFENVHPYKMGLEPPEFYIPAQQQAAAE